MAIKFDLRGFLRGYGTKYILVSISIVAIILLYPYFMGSNADLAAFTILITLVMVLAVVAVARSRRLALITLALMVPSLATQWVYLAVGGTDLVIVARLFSLLTLAFVTLVVLREVVKAKPPVPKDIIWGAIAVYFLLGLTWATLFSLIEIVSPGSFAYTVDRSIVLGQSDFLYFSFVTIATLGYGDIVPLTAQARSFAILEAVTGALYLAILISKLVGMSSHTDAK